uniref:Large ribosomal subunit protein uL29c n=1 Tax=Bulboplastis apyrenoidosa TaxID=1070855 RepID=A0A1Y9TM93_9RHOD|nr:50S ribosomal protein L29 [Bulboplastis apyrenoidosa]ARO90776.1 50S ribosomal protein L29 [Bulboplastis apyrenoidosa]
MNSKKSQEFRNLSQEEIEAKILSINKELLYLKIQKATRQNFKSHLFKYYRRQLAQLLTIKTEVVSESR